MPTLQEPDFLYDEDGLHQINELVPDPDAILMPPPSRPVRNRRPPSRFDPSPARTIPDNKITNKCRIHQHPGLGCAAVGAGHMPRYYCSLHPVCLCINAHIYLKFQYGDKTNYRCPYCAALLLRSEAKGINRYSKCCAKGKVKLHQRFQQLMRPFLPVNKRAVDAAMDAALQQADDETMVLDELLALLISDQHPESQNFMKRADRYNSELAFGSATTHMQPIPGGYQTVKMNGMVSYRLSGINPPLADDGTPREPLFGQVWTLNPDEAIALRQGRNIEHHLGLNVNT